MLNKVGSENDEEKERGHSSQYETMQISAILQPYPMGKDLETQEEGSTGMYQVTSDLKGCSVWSVVAEWLGRRTLNQRVVDSNPGEGTARYL
jgi:hypothetical protein